TSHGVHEAGRSNRYRVAQPLAGERKVEKEGLLPGWRWNKERGIAPHSTPVLGIKEKMRRAKDRGALRRAAMIEAGTFRGGATGVLVAARLSKPTRKQP